jgi:hypothetical protein
MPVFIDFPMRLVDAPANTSYSHSIVSDVLKPARTLAFVVLIITLYRHFYRQKISASVGAGDELGLRGGYSSPSIVNYHFQPRRHLL